MNRRQQAILRAYGTWQVRWILTDPAAGIAQAKQSMAGGSHLHVEGASYWYATTAKGIELRDRSGAAAVEILPWSVVQQYARSLDPVLVERLRDVGKRLAEHQRAYPRFAASGRAAGCGRAPVIGPPTKAQALYVDEYARWDRELSRPWHERHQALNAEQDALLDEALPLAATNEPTDLLELLAAGGAS